MVPMPLERAEAEPAWVRWVSRVLIAVSLVALGFFGGLFFWHLSPWAQSTLHGIAEDLRQQEQQLLQQCEPELRACEARVLGLPSPSLANPRSAVPNPQPEQNPQRPGQPQPKGSAGARKGSNGKH